jgi:mono/diheme cytochrome c family protein
MKKPFNSVFLGLLVLICLVVPATVAGCSSGNNSNTQPTSVESGQQIFSSNCASCHPGGAPNNSFTQAQMKNFISGHHTGQNLSSSQVAELAAFLKP